MATNSFKKLAEEVEQQYPDAPPQIESNLMGSMGITHFVGNVVELYIPRFFDMIMSLLGGVIESEPSPPINEKGLDGLDETPDGHPKSDA